MVRSGNSPVGRFNAAGFVASAAIAPQPTISVSEPMGGKVGNVVVPFQRGTSVFIDWVRLSF